MASQEARCWWRESAGEYHFAVLLTQRPFFRSITTQGASDPDARRFVSFRGPTEWYYCLSGSRFAIHTPSFGDPAGKYIEVFRSVANAKWVAVAMILGAIGCAIVFVLTRSAAALNPTSFTSAMHFGAGFFACVLPTGLIQQVIVGKGAARYGLVRLHHDGSVEFPGIQVVIRPENVLAVEFLKGPNARSEDRFPTRQCRLVLRDGKGHARYLVAYGFRERPELFEAITSWADACGMPLESGTAQGELEAPESSGMD